jgi:radical SAM protein with 4Fe4S-binding SPASM domain
MTTETVSDKLDRISRKGYPTIASIEVTERCNARCGYCYVKNNSPKELPTKQLFAAIEKLSKNGIIHLHITGGEPFLRSDILEVISFAIDHDIFYCTLFSNGTLLNDEHIDFLIQNRYFFRYIQMSVFSHISLINDNYFGVPGALDTIIKNALILKKNGLNMEIAMTVMDFNVDTLEQTRRFFENLNIPLSIAYDKIISSPLIEKLVSSSATHTFFKKYLQNLRSEELSDLKDQMKKSLAITPLNDVELCGGRWNTIFMNAQGNLSPCISFRNIIFGNIFEERSIQDILQKSPDYHFICAYKKNNMKKCMPCKFFNFCTICLGSIHTEKKSFCAPDKQICNFAKALYEILD